MTEKRDNLFLVGGIVGIVLWLKYSHRIPENYSDFSLLLLLALLIPFGYLLYLKRAYYHWSWEAIFYLFFLTLVGIISFSYSILGIEPLVVLKSLS
ncbi:MAG: hypothetical protein HY466_02695 [Deltaproteobacteria bacterium]|nr:hypothetical protein [Deltaproteobacteria bacterium]